MLFSVCSVGYPVFIVGRCKGRFWCDKTLWSAALLRLPSPPLHPATRKPGDSNFFQDILAQLPSCPRCDFGISHLFYSSFLDSKLLSGASRRDPPSRQEGPLKRRQCLQLHKWLTNDSSHVWGAESQELADYHSNIKNPNMWKYCSMRD